MGVINPYLEGMVEEIEIEHVIVADNVDKVEEFIIEHSMTEAPVPEEGEEADKNKEQLEQEETSKE